MHKIRIAAADIGGTKIKACLFEDGVMVKTDQCDTLAKEGGAKAVLQRTEALLQSFGVASATGISTAGQVDPASGIIRYANDNLPGYTGTDVKGFFEHAMGCPCTVANDVCAAALGEGAFGAACQESDYLCLTLGTGVGGALVLGGELYYGKGACPGGMVGGMILSPAQRNEEDPFSGAFEQMASTSALVASARRADPSLADGKVIFSRLDEPAVQEIVDRWTAQIAWGVVNLIHILNVPCVILGGGVMEQPYVLEAVRKKCLSMLIPGFQGVRILSAKLGNTAGLYGAYVLATKNNKGE